MNERKYTLIDCIIPCIIICIILGGMALYCFKKADYYEQLSNSNESNVSVYVGDTVVTVPADEVSTILSTQHTWEGWNPEEIDTIIMDEYCEAVHIKDTVYLFSHYNENQQCVYVKE